jgi:hypothetical protein
VTRLCLLAALSLLGWELARADTHYLIVSGIGGAPEYDDSFAAYARMLAEAAQKTITDESHLALLIGSEATSEAVTRKILDIAAATTEADTLAVFLVGHGSFDGEHYKLNLVGPDLSGDEIAGLLASVPAATQLIVNTTSASGAILEDWTADGRVLITATRSGAERNATRFGQYWAEALSSDEADTNKNGVVTAQEAFDFAARSVADSFERDGALATEHPQIVGDAAQRLNAARLVARTAETPEIAALNEELAAVEQRLDAHRLRRTEMEPEQYLAELQALLVELTMVQRRIDAARGADEPQASGPEE